MSTEARHCGSCAFYDDHHANGGTASKHDGLCRFNPPVSQPGPNAHGLWPVVTQADWCGHYVPQQATTLIAAE